ncbi:MAG: hypothetical protein AAF847_01775 [Bacteroidota bacterium]
MGYSNFKHIKIVVKTFDLELTMVRLFEEIIPQPPSDWLLQTLSMTEFLPPTNEKSKSERLISPILTEVVQAYKGSVTFFSGENIDIDSQMGLSGPCDFLFSLQAPKPYFEAPIIALAEAKDEDMDWGIAQCAAQVYGAKMYNDREDRKIPVLYGCATDGIEWHFMRLKDQLIELDTKIYTDLNQVLGIWKQIIEYYLD